MPFRPDPSLPPVSAPPVSAPPAAAPPQHAPSLARISARAPFRLLMLLLLAAVTGCSGGASRKATDPPPAPRAGLSAERIAEHLASFDQIWETVRDVHYDPNLNGADWEGLRASLRPRVAAATSDGEARRAMMELLDGLGQSHFAVVPAEAYDELERDPEQATAHEHEHPGSDAASGDAADTSGRSSADASHDGGGAHAEAASAPLPPRNRKGVGQPGFDIAVVGDRAVVCRVVPDSSAAQAGVALGWILESVDGRPVSRAIEAVRSFSPSEAEMIMKRAILHEFAGDPGEQVDVVFLDGADERRELRLSLAEPKFVQEPFFNMPRTAVDWEFSRVGDIGIFRLGIFMHFPIRLELERFIDENPDLAGMVIDLRGNPGGIGFMANGICGHLIDEADLRLGTMSTRDQVIHFSIQPQVTIFEGPLAVLIDGGSASTSEILAAGLKDLGRARLFGSNTAGAALPSMFVRLPNGDGFQYAIANYTSTGGEVLEGDGVAPDVEVAMDRARLLDGVDPVLEAAVEWIRSR